MPAPALARHHALLALLVASLAAMWPYWSPDVALLLGDLVGYFPSLYSSLPAEWDPMVQGGTPLLANPQAGFFYPPAWLLRRDLQAWLPLYVALHLWVGAAACHALVRRWLGDGWPALLAGLVFALSGPSISLALTPDKLPGHAALPVLLLGLSYGLDDHRPALRRWGLVTAVVAVAAAWLGGSVEGVFTMGLLAPAFAAFLPGAAGGPRTRIRRGAVAVVALLLGTALAGCALVPFFLLLPETDRVGSLPLAEAMHRATYPVDWLGWLTPNPFWSGDALRYVLDDAGSTRARWLRSLYGGALALTLLPALLVARARPTGTRRFTLFALGFVVLALGDLSPLRDLVHALPGLGSVRYPDKWWLGTVPLQAFLLAFGLHAARHERRAAAVAAGAAATLGGLGLLALGWTGGGPGARAAIALTTVWPALLVAAAILSRWARGLPAPAFLLVALCAVDLLAGGLRALPQTDEAAAAAASPAVQALHADFARSAGPPRLWDDSLHVYNRLPDAPWGLPFRRMERAVLAPNLGVEHGIAYVDGLRALRMARQRRFSGPLEELPLPARRQLLRLAGADYWMVYDQREALAVAEQAGLRPVASAPGAPLDVGLLAEPDPLPRLRLVTRWEVVPDEDAARRRLPSLSDDSAVLIAGDPGVDASLARMALHARPPDFAPPIPPLVQVSAPRPGVWEGRWEPPTSGLLVLAEGWATGWEASLDGGPFTPCVPVNYAFVGTFATDGTTHAVLRYRAPGRRSGWVVSVCAGLATIGCAFAGARRRSHFPRA